MAKSNFMQHFVDAQMLNGDRISILDDIYLSIEIYH